MENALSQNKESNSGPWWKYGHVWLVVSGPLLVIIAGIITAIIAIDGADPVIDENYYQNGLEINERLRAEKKNMAPAQAARNHAATPDEDLPPLKP